LQCQLRQFVHLPQHRGELISLESGALMKQIAPIDHSRVNLGQGALHAPLAMEGT